MPKPTTTLKPAAFAKTWYPTINLVFPTAGKERAIQLSIDHKNMTLMVSETDEKNPAGFYVIADNIDPIGRWNGAAREVAAELVLINVIAAEDMVPTVKHLASLIKAMVEAMPPEDQIPE